MKMTRDYFNSKARVALQFQTPDGGLFYEYSSPNNIEQHVRFMELIQHCTFKGQSYQTEQDNDHIQNFLNQVDYKQKYSKKYKGMTFEEILDEAIKAELEVD